MRFTIGAVSGIFIGLLAFIAGVGGLIGGFIMGQKASEEAAASQESETKSTSEPRFPQAP